MQHLIRDDAVVIHHRIEHHPAKMPGRGVEVTKLILQLDSTGIVDAAFTGRRPGRH